MSTFDYDWLYIGSGPPGQGSAIHAAKLMERAAISKSRAGISSETTADCLKCSFAARDAFSKLTG